MKSDNENPKIQKVIAKEDGSLITLKKMYSKPELVILDTMTINGGPAAMAEGNGGALTVS